MGKRDSDNMGCALLLTALFTGICLYLYYSGTGIFFLLLGFLGAIISLLFLFGWFATVKKEREMAKRKERRKAMAAKASAEAEAKKTPRRKSNFNTAFTAAANLYSECLALSKNPQVLAALDSHEELDPMKELTLSKDLDNRINILAVLDTIKCFNHLGHEADFHTEEGLVLGLFLLHITSMDTEEGMCKSEQTLRSEKSRKVMADTYTFYNNSFIFLSHRDKILLLELMRKRDVDEQVINSFAVKLYRFAMCIAQADNNVTKKEKEKLANLISIPTKPHHTAEPQQPSPTDPLKELNSLIGIEVVKAEVTKIYNLIKIQKAREAKGMKLSNISYHCVFTGNPGTGKTTVARLIARIYKDLGILRQGHLVETDRSGLVAEYVGQTAIKTNKIIDTALDGVLFIDEAYSLMQGGEQDYGREAIATLLKRMEDDRNRLVVILAGYSDEMHEFINTNPGLKSRFNRYIRFEDFDAHALAQIYEYNIAQYDYALTPQARHALQTTLSTAVANKDKNFGNARYARNLFEKTQEKQAMRLAQEPNLTTEILREITEEDIPGC